jgi:cell division protease FtsH
MNRARFLALLLGAALALALGAGAASARPLPGTGVHESAPESRDGEPMEYSELLRALAAGTIREAEVDDATSSMEVTLANGDVRKVSYPLDAEGLIDRLAESGAAVRVARSERGPSPFVFLPPLLMVGLGVTLMVLFLQQRRGALGKSRQAAAKKAQIASERPPVRFDDVAGCDEAVEELREMLDFLRTPERFARVGARMPSAVMLYGPPGTGKTLLARALAGEAGVPFFAASGSDFIELYVGVGAKRIRDLFAQARKHPDGAVVFIDEIDAIGKRRGDGQGGTSNDERDQTLNALLVELDGFTTSTKIVCVAATNRMDVLDPALLRPGRFGRQIAVDLPDETGRAAILDVHAAGKPIDGDVSLERIARSSSGLSGAQLSEVVNEAAIMAARADRDRIVQSDFDEAQLRVLIGPEKRSSMLAEGELEIVAYHEAGHVLTAELCPNHDKTQRATVRPRGRAAGLALYGRSDRSLQDAAYIHEQMVCGLGGRAAEQIVFGTVSSGAANDLAVVNSIARRAIEELGFSPRVGQIVRTAQGQPMQLSQETLALIDREVERVVADAYRDALLLLTRHRDSLESLAQLLLTQGDVERVDILTALGRKLDPAELSPVMGTREMHPEQERPAAKEQRVVVPFQPKRRGIVQRLAAAIVERSAAQHTG